jgi:1,4-dihydroxy-2-naphthoate octaprenyltransferase/chlorophyll synthase
MPGLLALSLSSALASGLSDEESDQAGGKRTWASVRGNTAARRGSEALLVLGAVLWLAAPVVARMAPWLAVVPVAVVLFFAARVRGRSADAVTNAFGALSAYKLELHRAIWWGTLALSGFILLDGLGMWGGARA